MKRKSNLKTTDQGFPSEMKPEFHPEYGIYSFNTRFFRTRGIDFEIVGTCTDTGKIIDRVKNLTNNKCREFERNKLATLIIEG